MSGLFSRHSAEHAVAGSAGTILATLLLFPLDRVKTLTQVQRSAGISQVVLKVLEEEGLDGFYRGCAPMLQTVGTSNFIYFLFFEGLKDGLAKWVERPEGEIGPYETLTASALSGALTMLLTEPLWRACTVAQAQTRPALAESSAASSAQRPARAAAGAFGTARAMWRAEGPGALWRGLGSSLWLVSNPVIQFLAYDFLKAARLERGGREAVSSLEAFLMGALAKALATLLTFPLQLAQSRLRAAQKGAGCEERPELKGMVPCLRAVLREGGVAGLYVGLAPKLLQTVTQAAFMFAIYEKVHWAIRRLNRQGGKGMRRLVRRGLKQLKPR